MKYYESEVTELKREVTPEIKKEIIAFLNTHGGTIYVGVDDRGILHWDLSRKEKDIEESKIINWLAGNVISPNPQNFINLNWNEDGVLEISVSEGDNKPYYLTNVGCNNKGVFVRFETSKFPATTKQIEELKLESNNLHYEDLLSNFKLLDFKYLENKVKENKCYFNYETCGLLKENKYTNLAYLLSDNFKQKAKIYLVDNKNNIIKRKFFKGSILKQIDDILNYFVNIKNYDQVILKEALINAFVHRNWQVNETIKIEVSPNKINFISPGGIYNLKTEDVIEGKTNSRNPKLVKVFKMLNYVNLFKYNGIKEIYNRSKKHQIEPVIMATSKMFIISIPKNKR